MKNIQTTFQQFLNENLKDNEKLKLFEQSLIKEESKLFYDLPTSFTIDDLRKAYTDGQNSVQVKMKQKESYDEYGDMIVKLVGEKEITKKFEDWLEENWD